MNPKRENQREVTFNVHRQFNEKPQPQPKQQQDQELMCACGSDVKCEGICRELYLHRPRMANPTAKKDTGVQKSWADKCPEAYELPKKEVHYRA